MKSGSRPGGDSFPRSSKIIKNMARESFFSESDTIRAPFWGAKSFKKGSQKLTKRMVEEKSRRNHAGNLGKWGWQAFYWAHAGLFWARLGPFGPIWAFLGPFGSFWTLLGSFGPFWVPLGPFWAHLGPFGPIWSLYKKIHSTHVSRKNISRP